MNALLESMLAKLEKSEAKGLRRRLKSQEAHFADFFSNDYLSMAQNEEVLAIADGYFKQKSLSSKLGATGSRLLSGNYPGQEELEGWLANFFDAESTLLYTSGFAANQGLITALARRNDTIIYDELAHACIIDGARLSMAKKYNFRHNDPADLEKKLKAATGNAIVVVESLYSMDGDVCPLEDILEVCQAFDAALLVDEAHSTGVYGSEGQGYCFEKGLHEEVFARVHTFGKGPGVHGAVVAGPQVLKDYLINFSRTFIFSTAMPFHSLCSIRASLEYLRDHPQLRNQLFDRVAYFRHKIEQCSFSDAWLDSFSPIQALLVPGNEQVLSLSKELIKEEINCLPIRYPVVPEGKERLRVCLHCHNSEKQMDHLFNVLEKNRKRYHGK